MTGYPSYPPPPPGWSNTRRSPGLPLIAGLLACVGMVIGCTGTWVDVAVFSIGGLDDGQWGKVWLGVAVVAAIILTATSAGLLRNYSHQVSLGLLWGVFVAAVACAGYALPFVIRVLTLPKAELLGLRMGAQVGWGLWLLVVSAGVLAAAAATAAAQTARGLPDGQRYRDVALALALAITLGWVVYYFATWEGGSPGLRGGGDRPAGSNWPFDDQRGESTSSVPTSTAAAGDEVPLGEVQVEVPGIWLQELIGSGRSPLSTHEPRGIWVVAPIKVTNTSNERQRFDTTGQELVVDGKSYSGSPFAADDVVSDARSSILLNPGLSGYVVAVFDVPPGIFPASEAALNLRPDNGGPHVLVSVNTAPKLQSAVSDPTTRSQAPSSTRRPIPSAPSKPAEVPPRSSPDLGLTVPLSRPSCDGTGIVVLGSAYTPGKYRQEVARLLELNPGASYLRTDLACPSLRQNVDGNPIYAVYRVAGTTRAQVCAAVAAAGAGTYGKWLDSDSDPTRSINCGN